MEEIIKELKRIIDFIDGNIYIVGGYIRDLIKYGKNNINSDDIDIIFSGDIDYLIEALKDNNYKIFSLKASLGIYRAIKGKSHIDIALLKGDNLYKDLKSRDFTINSICMNIKNDEIIDYFNGVSHIKNGILKETSKNSINADPVRILRGLRFVIEYDLQIDKPTLNHIIEEIDKIETCPKERIFIEFMKIIKVDSEGILGVLLEQIKQHSGRKILYTDNKIFCMRTYNIYKKFMKNKLNFNQIDNKVFNREIAEFEIELFLGVATILMDNTSDSNNIIRYSEKLGVPKTGQELIIKIINGTKFVIDYYKKDLKCFKSELYDFFKGYANYLPYILIVSYCKDVFASNMRFEELLLKFNTEYIKFNAIKENKLLKSKDIIKLTGVKGRIISEAIELIDKEVYLGNIKTKEDASKVLIQKYLC
ncbi:CCA tRNA nucleotidyltransferase [Clostridium sediminicola]|uniref:hypothetical protein n=1 Tax=Clostridium sediminicola TaxID=3114879 RepID=UPI0031F1D23B